MKIPLVGLMLLWCGSAFAGPRVDIVIGETAPPLEKLAAEELAIQLRRVYDAEVRIAAAAPADSSNMVFVGSPQTNAAMQAFAEHWPSGEKKLSEQGHLLRSVMHDKRPALLVGGGSPAATYWAAAEFGHRLGFRAMLFGDLPPVAPPEFSLEGFSTVIEPPVRFREWRFANQLPLDSAAFGRDEYRAMLGQLAKLKFNRVSLTVDASQPFLRFEAPGVTMKSGVQWGGVPLPVSGDTLGRKAFSGAKLFENPDLAGAATYDERIAAGEKLLRGVIDAAHEFGLSVQLAMPFSEFPIELATVLPISDTTPRTASGLAFRPRPILAETSPAVYERMSERWARYAITYPQLDGFEFSHSQPKDWLEESRRALSSMFLEPNHNLPKRKVPLEILLFDESSADAVSSSLKAATAGRMQQALHVRLNSPDNVLPLLRHASLPTIREKLAAARCDGFIAESHSLGDLDFSAYCLSRAAAGASNAESNSAETGAVALRELLTPVCGEEVDGRVAKAFSLIDQATQLIDANGGTLCSSSNIVAELAAKSAEPPPVWWAEVRDCYLNAMNEMYRANTRARDGGRAYTLYFARRFEFAFEYMNCLEAVRKAALAEKAGDSATQIAELEKAIESLNGGLNAMAAVARSSSDRGLIAWLNERGYRPLQRKLAEADAAAK